MQQSLLDLRNTRMKSRKTKNEGRCVYDGCDRIGDIVLSKKKGTFICKFHNNKKHMAWYHKNKKNRLSVYRNNMFSYAKRLGYRVIPVNPII